MDITWLQPHTLKRHRPNRELRSHKGRHQVPCVASIGMAFCFCNAGFSSNYPFAVFRGPLGKLNAHPKGGSQLGVHWVEVSRGTGARYLFFN